MSYYDDFVDNWRPSRPYHPPIIHKAENELALCGTIATKRKGNDFISKIWKRVDCYLCWQSSEGQRVKNERGF